MTMVIGRADFSSRTPALSLMADTMISRLDRVRDDVFPGLLKIVTIAEGLSVAFSGDAELARDRILSARASYLSSLELRTFLRAVEAHTRDDRCEFLVASTVHRPRLIKFWQGQSAEGATFRLGDSAPFARAPDIDERYGHPGLSRSAKVSISFLDLFVTEGTKLAPSVGGFGVVLDCRPGAHVFMDYASSISWDHAAGELSDDQIRDRASGMNNMSASCISSRWPNAPVIGLYIDQLSGGWIYDPLTEPEPIRLTTVSVGEMQEEIERRSAAAFATFPKGHPKEPAPIARIALTPGRTELIEGPPYGFTTRRLSIR